MYWYNEKLTYSLNYTNYKQHYLRRYMLQWTTPVNIHVGWDTDTFIKQHSVYVLRHRHLY
jgi:hypothetical protein